MKFAIIDPKAKTFRFITKRGLEEAAHAADLPSGELDHGVVHMVGINGGIGIVVHEYSLFVPPAEQCYFALGGQLYGGNAVLYGFDEAGETVNMDVPLIPIWFDDSIEAEMAIIAGAVKRPQIAVGGNVLWRWPDQPLQEMGR